MILSKKRFDQSIIRIRNSHSLYIHLVENNGFEESIVSEMLRSEVVNSISALDRFVHDLVLEGILQIYLNLREQTSSYKNLNISIVQHKTLSTSILPEVDLRQIILQKHKYLAFQEPAKISTALSLIWNESHKWQKLSSILGLSENDAKVKLKNIVMRRNQIVHESDVDIFTGSEMPIVKTDVEDSVNFIENLGNAIYSSIN
jgi:hypothetical protein